MKLNKYIVNLKKQLENLQETYELVKEESDEDLMVLLEEDYISLDIVKNSATKGVLRDAFFYVVP